MSNDVEPPVGQNWLVPPVPFNRRLQALTQQDKEACACFERYPLLSGLIHGQRSNQCRTAQLPMFILMRFVPIEPGNHPRAG